LIDTHEALFLKSSMDKFPTKYMILEGPDLSGKTTLYNELHRQTKYKWNIQDRSALSMLCYARLYKRNVEEYRQKLHDEINDLNNRVVVLLPPFHILKSRYEQRGDEIQDLVSLTTLYDIFVEESRKIHPRPNVMVLMEDNDLESLVTSVFEWSACLENSDPYNVGEILRDTLRGSVNDEAVIRASLFIDDQKMINSTILSHEKEGDYYSEVYGESLRIIQDEIAGRNLYNKPQTRDSRRFIYSSDTCISCIHFLPRENQLKVMATLRSTDVIRNASIDLEFLGFIAASVNKTFEWGCTEIILNVQFNSAHIRRDLE